MKYNQHNLNSAEDDGLCFKYGMGQIAQDDGWQWTRAELSDAYFIIYMKGIDKNNHLLQRFFILSDDEDKIRKYIIDIDDLTEQDLEFINDETKNDTARIAVLYAKSHENI
jgi:hypothetical protein